MSQSESRLPASPASSSSASTNPRRFRTQFIDEMVSEFSNLGLQVGDGILEQKTDPGISGERIRILTNVFGVQMCKIPVYRYDVSISGINRVDYKVEFTKRAKDDFVVVDRKNMCRLTFSSIIEKYSWFFGKNPYALFYDLQSILYTLKELEFIDENEIIFDLSNEDCTKFQELHFFKSIKILIRKVSSGFELTLGDLSAITNDTTNQNHSLQHFIELAVNQAVLFNANEHMTLNDGASFLMRPSQFGFRPEDGPYLGSNRTKYLGIGAHKSVRYVEGPYGHGDKHAALVVNIKKTPFHQINVTLLDKAWDCLNFNPHNPTPNQPNLHIYVFDPIDISKLNKQLKALYVELRHGRVRNLKISGVSDKNATDYEIEFESKLIPLEDYYFLKYGVKLLYPNVPLATAIERNKTNYYPLELCYVKDFQRVSANQMTFRETAEMIRACANPPDILKDQIQKTIRSIHLEDSMYLYSAGIKVNSQPLLTEGRVLAAPKINFKNKVVRPNKEGKFPTTDHFLVTSVCNKWEMNFIPGKSTLFTIGKLNKFIAQYVDCCHQYGMIMAPSSKTNVLDGTVEEIYNVIKSSKQKRCDFVMFVTEDKITNLHDVIKSCEQKYQIVTQDLKLSNVSQIVTSGKPETLRNIVAKTNEKLGGLNYTITLQDKYIHGIVSQETLFIGFGVSHSGPLGEYKRLRDSQTTVPSVIGYAANTRKDPFDFVGDFLYNEPRRDEKVLVIQTIVENCIIRFQASRKKYPKRVVIYKNGTSESQYGMTLQYEIPVIRNAFKRLNINCKLTVLVLQHFHNIRLFSEPLAPWNYGKPNLNIRPGTVVDTKITHPMQSEFYLNSHLAIKGTSRTPRYTILVDDSKFSMDVIENITYCLTFAHQIINSPTSLPSPVYIALLYAKRGRALYSVYQSQNKDQNTIESVRRLEDLSNRLSFTNTTLANQRVNA